MKQIILLDKEANRLVLIRISKLGYFTGKGILIGFILKMVLICVVKLKFISNIFVRIVTTRKYTHSFSISKRFASVWTNLRMQVRRGTLGLNRWCQICVNSKLNYSYFSRYFTKSLMTDFFRRISQVVMSSPRIYISKSSNKFIAETCNSNRYTKGRVPKFNCTRGKRKICSNDWNSQNCIGVTIISCSIQLCLAR